MTASFEREPPPRQNDSLSRLKAAIMRMIPVFKMSPIHSFPTQTSPDGPAVWLPVNADDFTSSSSSSLSNRAVRDKHKRPKSIKMYL